MGGEKEVSFAVGESQEVRPRQGHRTDLESDLRLGSVKGHSSDLGSWAAPVRSSSPSEQGAPAGIWVTPS